MSKQKFFILLDRYLAGKATDQEQKSLFDIYQRMENDSDFDVRNQLDVKQIENGLLEQFGDIVRERESITEQPIPPTMLLNSRLRPFYIAASLLILLSISIYTYRVLNYKTEGYAAFENGNDSNLIEIENLEINAKNFEFPDGSFVRLNHGGRIRFQRGFAGGQRKVFMKGSGFFQVTKNARKPFVVFTDHLVTKVLGTSFTISSDEKTKVSVTVITGRVAVFKADSFKVKNLQANLNDGLLLTPNHKAALNRENVLIEDLADRPQVVGNTKNISFEFESTPVSEVFRRLKQAYNIDISYDEQKLNHCTLTVDMANEDFFTKLILICNTLNLSYKNLNGQILITGEGCSK